MKKMALNNFVLFFCCLFVFNSCGLEVFNKPLTSPEKTYNIMQITEANSGSSTPFDSSYFDFETNESNQPDIFEGTAVYYKIYNNYSTMNSHISTMSSLANSTNASASATKMIELNYQELDFAVDVNNDGSNMVRLPVSPMISKDLGHSRVYIRLTNRNQSEFIACVKLLRSSDSGLKYWMYNTESRSTGSFDTLQEGYAANYSRIVPMRKDGELNFDFGRKYKGGKNDGNKVVPVSGDDDTNISSTSSAEGMWYVTLYAVSVGYDSENFDTYYSGVLYLGSVGISENSEDN